PVPRAAPGQRPGPGDRGGHALVDRELLRGGQAGGGAGPRRGPLVGGVVPARDAVDARPGVPRRRAGAGGGFVRPASPAATARKKGTATADLVPLTEPEVRRLMLAIVWPVLSDAERALTWSHWRR